jgi:hypothetical protein
MVSHLGDGHERRTALLRPHHDVRVYVSAEPKECTCATQHAQGKAITDPEETQARHGSGQSQDGKGCQTVALVPGPDRAIPGNGDDELWHVAEVPEQHPGKPKSGTETHPEKQFSHDIYLAFTKHSGPY